MIVILLVLILGAAMAQFVLRLGPAYALVRTDQGSCGASTAGSAADGPTSEMAESRVRCPTDARSERSGTRQRSERLATSERPRAVPRRSERAKKMAPGRECRRAWGGLGGFVDIGEPISTPPALAHREPSSFPRGTLVLPGSTEPRESLS